MNDNIDELIMLLADRDIRYFLLRPVDLENTVMDLDLIVPEEDLGKLKKVLLAEYGSILYRKSRARQSIQIIANEIILDIKFKVCFLPEKSLVLSTAITYPGVKKVNRQLLIPDCPSEELFTFWTYHLFLDKNKPEASTTYGIYREFYADQWVVCLRSNFFKRWSEIIFKNGSEEALHILETGFNNGMDFSEKRMNRPLRKLLFKQRPALWLAYVYDRIKFAIFRRTGIHGNYEEIRKVAY
jgi:hypothetical protein